MITRNGSLDELASELAEIHARCFSDAPRPWSADEIAGMLGMEGTLLAVRPSGFGMARVAGPEGEILTLAVLPEGRRQGAGAALLAELEVRAAKLGAETMFLEVAEPNGAARALYSGAKYASAGFRRDYYAQGPSRRISALVLRKPLLPTEAGTCERGESN